MVSKSTKSRGRALVNIYQQLSSAIFRIINVKSFPHANMGLYFIAFRPICMCPLINIINLGSFLSFNLKLPWNITLFAIGFLKRIIPFIKDTIVKRFLDLQLTRVVGPLSTDIASIN